VGKNKRIPKVSKTVITMKTMKVKKGNQCGALHPGTIGGPTQNE
jgi:hypothetical protein